MKLSSTDIVAILRRFGLAGDETTPRMIERIKLSHPSSTNILAAFRFQKLQLFVLLDAAADDDVDYIIEQIETEAGRVSGKLQKNPNDAVMTYGLPFKGKDAYLFVAQSKKVRLDAELARRHPESSRSTWQKHIKAGRISVDGVVQTSVKFDVSDHDSIEITLPDKADFTGRKLSIIYIDDNVIVINKPIGVLSHAKGAINEEFTVAEFFRPYTTFNQESNRPGIVHRLDRDTSGVMIGARTEEAAQLLQKQFSERTTHKTYFAIVKGRPKLDLAKIDLPIGRNPAAPSSFRVDAKGKPAQTNYEVVQTNDAFSLLKLKPKTGRTHQLRVHLAHIGTPIVGDRVYGKPSDRMYLHAEQLEITIPVGQRKTFQADLPEDFRVFLKDRGVK